MKGEMREGWKGVATICFFCAVALIIGMVCFAPVGWVSSTLHLAHYSFFAPKYANVERKVFEETKSYNDGMAQDLSKAQQEYIQLTDPVQKKAMAGIIPQRFANYDVNRLPEYLQTFLSQLRREQEVRFVPAQ